MPLVLLDDNAGACVPNGVDGSIACAFGADRIASALGDVEVIVKSPGVSLYRREIQALLSTGVEITSLLNLWFAEQLAVTTVCVTGTKGKSTTAALITHMLARLGQRVALVGNIGVPITEVDAATADYAVIEVSSYQAADFVGLCDVAVLTSLFPEHLDWHLSLDSYLRDKLNLLSRSRRRLINCYTAETAEAIIGKTSSRNYLFNDENGIHCDGPAIFDGRKSIGEVHNPYLARPHNTSNLCAALAVMTLLDVDTAAALGTIDDFRGLAHRQQELGEIGGILFVDDSISTIPESTIAALGVYAGRNITAIVGGYDRGIDYGKLVARFSAGAAGTIICLGDSGKRIFAELRALSDRRGRFAGAMLQAQSMEDAVSYALQVTPPGGVVLLSPASPSYGHYRDYIERGRDFAAKAGLPIP
jgi:UDP-N-acetylmuramoyl-L-alanine---L-glutamate ligase